MRATSAREGSRAGFTLIEVCIASVVLIVLWYALAGAMNSGTRSQEVLMDAAAELAEMRRSNDLLLEDLRATGAGAMSIETLEDGNDVLELQHPIRVEGALAWGVRTTGHALDDPTTGEPGWSIRYAVGGDSATSLVRQVLAADGTVQSEQVVVTQLSPGDPQQPSFSITRQGEMWRVHIAQADHQQGHPGPGTEFHVRMRN
jgi:hypothetical protein